MAKLSAYEKRVLRVLKTLEGADGGYMDTEELEKKAFLKADNKDLFYMREDGILIYDLDLKGWMIAPLPEPDPEPGKPILIDVEPQPEPEPERPVEPEPERPVKGVDAAAFHGLAGDFVRLVEPESEADLHALLLSFLIEFGVMVGESPYYLTEATLQHVNEFGVIVGDTAKARKTTATERSMDFYRRVDAEFMDSQVCRGLTTGEGMIYRIRDSRVMENGKLDPGVTEKRLLCIETEFSSVLRSIRMNKLSEDIRNAYDCNPMERILRRHSYGCRNPHIAIIGNITVDELRGKLKGDDRSNGFGNRFLWVWTTRSKLRPFGGEPLDATKLTALVSKVQRH